MRPIPKTLYANLRLAYIALAVCTALAAVPARAQQTPATILSSGGTAVSAAAAPTSHRLGDSPSGNAPSWTAVSNPAANQLRPQIQPGYPPLPSAEPSVVTAAAQTTLSETNTHDNTTDRSQHIPLAPPSERFKGEATPKATGTLQMIVSVGSSLLLVVGLFLGVAWCYRKTVNSTIGSGLSKQVVHVLGRSSISPRQQMVLIRFGSKLLLVSVIQGEARTLSEITDPLEVDQLVGLCESGQAGSISNSFRSVLLQEGKR